MFLPQKTKWEMQAFIGIILSILLHSVLGVWFSIVIMMKHNPLPEFIELEFISFPSAYEPIPMPPNETTEADDVSKADNVKTTSDLEGIMTNVREEEKLYIPQIVELPERHSILDDDPEIISISGSKESIIEDEYASGYHSLEGTEVGRKEEDPGTSITTTTTTDDKETPTDYNDNKTSPSPTTSDDTTSPTPGGTPYGFDGVRYDWSGGGVRKPLGYLTPDCPNNLAEATIIIKFYVEPNGRVKENMIPVQRGGDTALLDCCMRALRELTFMP